MTTFWERAAHWVSHIIFTVLCLFVILVVSHFGFESGTGFDCTSSWSLLIFYFAPYNNLVLANTQGYHKLSRKWTWHSPDGVHHNKIDNSLLKKRFGSSIKFNFSELDLFQVQMLEVTMT